MDLSLLTSGAGYDGSLHQVTVPEGEGAVRKNQRVLPAHVAESLRPMKWSKRHEVEAIKRNYQIAAEFAGKGWLDAADVCARVFISDERYSTRERFNAHLESLDACISQARRYRELDLIDARVRRHRAKKK